MRNTYSAHAIAHQRKYGFRNCAYRNAESIAMPSVMIACSSAALSSESDAGSMDVKLIRYPISSARWHPPDAGQCRPW